MAKWKFQGLDEYIAQLEKLTNDREYIGPTIYEGAAVVADEMKKKSTTFRSRWNTHQQAGKSEASLLFRRPDFKAVSVSQK